MRARDVRDAAAVLVVLAAALPEFVRLMWQAWHVRQARRNRK